MTKSPQKSEKANKNDGFEDDRRRILTAALDLAPFEGWMFETLRHAAADGDVSPAALKSAFPRGNRDLLRFWSEQLDEAVLAAMAGPAFEALKICEKVSFGVNARIDALRPHKEAARRAAAMLALPPYALLGAELAWKTADAIWRGLGDKSTDFNWYSKRGILSGVWTATFARWLADDSEDEAATNAFLDARIDNVMQIEKAKSRMKKLGLDPAAPIEFLARLRYPLGR